MFNKDYKGSGNGQVFNRGGIASDTNRKFWVVIEAGTYTPDDDKCASAFGGAGVSFGAFGSTATTSNTNTFHAPSFGSPNVVRSNTPSYPSNTAASFGSPSFSASFNSHTTTTTTPSFNTAQSFGTNSNTRSYESNIAPSFTAPSFGPAASQLTTPQSPSVSSDCSRITSPCQCLGKCGWSTGAGQCKTATSTTFTDCNECASQAKCQPSQCSGFVTPCQCAMASGCGWKGTLQRCVPGSTTKCSECPSKPGCPAPANANH